MNITCTGTKTEGKIDYRNFTEEIFNLAADGISVDEIVKLRKEHGRFFTIWFNEIIPLEQFGAAPDSIKAKILSNFLKQNQQVYKAIMQHYKAYTKIDIKVGEAFAKLQNLIGKIKAPVLYNYFSQFSNYTTFVDTANGKTILGFSSEMFMNDTFVLYKLLDVPEFFNRYNATDQIAPMLVWNYLKSVYEPNSTGTKMIDEAVFNGKIWYTMARVFEDSKPWFIYGYSQKEWEQMMREEGQIWRHYITTESLFKTDFNAYKRYFNYGNHTFGGGIPQDCPPLIGNFSGFRIVSEFMNNTKTSIIDMWKENDAEKILRLSGYNPVK